MNVRKLCRSNSERGWAPAVILLIVACSPDFEKPALDGVWELNRGWTNHPDDIAGTGLIPDYREYTLPEALAAWDQQKPLDDPKLRCESPTVVGVMTNIHAIAIDQSGDDVVMLYSEYFDTVRTVYMDGREHPGAGTPHSKLGHSIGWYEDNTLVVETTHISAGHSVAGGGPPHSDSLQVIERYRVINDGRILEQTVIMEDPETFTEPVTLVNHERRAPFNELVPFECMPLGTARGSEISPEEFYNP